MNKVINFNEYKEKKAMDEISDNIEKIDVYNSFNSDILNEIKRMKIDELGFETFNREAFVEDFGGTDKVRDAIKDILNLR